MSQQNNGGKRVSFYIMGEQSLRSIQQVACKLCVKAVKQTTVTLVAQTEDQLTAMDDLLWSFSATSFLPHGINSPSAHINLVREPTEALRGIVINLSDDAILSFAGDRLIEIIGNDEQQKQRGRQRYRAYQEKNFALETFTI